VTEFDSPIGLLFGLEIAVQDLDIVSCKKTECKKYLKAEFSDQAQVHSGKVAHAEQFVEIVRQDFVDEAQVISKHKMSKKAN
jgi:hypothetical protein